MKYVATTNIPGYLPMDDEPPTFDSARSAWEWLVEELERSEDLAWAPDDPQDPEGPHSATPTLLELQRQADADKVGTVYGPSRVYDEPGDEKYDLGLAYSVDYAEDDGNERG